MQYKIPPKVPKKTYSTSMFLGNDFTNSVTNVAHMRSPLSINTVRDEVGKVRKRNGTFEILRFDVENDGVVFGAVEYKEHMIVHTGKNLYSIDEKGEKTNIYQQMNEGRSVCINFLDEKLYIFDGVSYLQYDGESVKRCDNIGTVPLINRGRTPTGGGVAYKAVNLLSAWRTESFSGTEAEVEYKLLIGGIDPDKVKAKKLRVDGEYDTLTEGTHFTVDRANGKVTFKTAPGVSPITNIDNIEITYAKLNAESANKINKCTVCATYGVNGNADRIFCAGNDEFKNRDFWCEFEDALYFPDVNYALLGSAGSGIMGYCVLNDNLITFKEKSDDGRNAFLRRGVLENGEAFFRISDTLQGEPILCKNSVGYLVGEPVYLARGGVNAVSVRDVTGAKYTQARSFYLNGAVDGFMYRDSDNDEHYIKLDLATARVVSYGDYYIVYNGKNAFLLDGMQKSGEQNTPYAPFQYELFMWQLPHNIDLMFEYGEKLMYTAGGAIYEFYSEKGEQRSFNDDELPIYACWDTAYISGEQFFKNNTFTKIAVQLDAYIKTGCAIYAEVDGRWEYVGGDEGQCRYFSFEYVDFSDFTFSTNTTSSEFVRKYKVKKESKVRFRIENSKINEPFVLSQFAVVFKEQRSDFKG